MEQLKQREELEMNFKKTKGIIRRELKDKLFSKSFVIMTLLIPGIIFLSVGIQSYMMSYDSDTTKKVMIVTEIPNLSNELQKEFKQSDIGDSKEFVLTFEEVNEKDFMNNLEKLKPLLMDESLNGIVFIPKDALKNKEIRYYSKNPKNRSLTGKLSGVINQVLVTKYFAGRDIDQKDISYAKKSVYFNTMKVSSQNIEKEGFGGEIISFGFTFLLYMGLMLSGTLILRSVIEEKNNRIVEVLLSSVSSNDLMVGKIIGASLTALAQMFIWITPIILILSTTWFMLPAGLKISISVWQWLYFFLNFLIGIVTFLGLFAAVGAIFDNDQDAQSGLWPVMMLIMIPFFIALSVGNNPSNSLAVYASMFPFSAIIVMPARMALVEVPISQFIISIVVSLITLILVFPLSGKIYRIGILMTGKKPTWKEVASWVKAKN
jgi:ABC-2 type transport system permease protein